MQKESQTVLVVKVELWPGGREAEAVEVGRAAIANVSGLAELSDYVVIATNNDGGRLQRVVRGHRRSDGFWVLLARAFAPGSPKRLPRQWRKTGELMAERAGLPEPS